MGRRGENGRASPGSSGGRLLAAALGCAVLASAGHVAAVNAATAGCAATMPTRITRPAPASSAAGFDYGNTRLRVQLGWPNGTLAAGVLPDGGSLATVGDDGSVHVKLGWWRGVAGRLSVTGRRLDAAAPPLTAHVPTGYGMRGFQPTGLVFPTDGCWRVVGRVGDVRLGFVVEVTRLPRR